MSGRERAGLASLLLAAALLLGGCGRSERWSVLLVTFDTTRADHLGCYGNRSIRTPHADALAARGVRFARAYAAIPLTAPSHSTILTGKYPIAHGVRDNGMFELPDHHQTLAEVLRQHGWDTAAAIGAFPLIRRFGIAQGFDLYDDAIDAGEQHDPGRRALPRARLYFDERRAERVNEALYPWLEAHRDEPFFVWAHYFDPHHPLEPPPPYDQLYAGDPYAGEIAYADEAFGNLIDRLEQLGVNDRTIVVLAADHGEGLGEHREITHSMQLYNSTLRVPLIVSVPGGRSGAVVESAVGTVDILPTLLDLLGVEVPAGVQGRSLAAELAGEAAAPRPPLYAETLSPRLSYGWGELRALLDEDHKYVFGPRPELFDLAADPGELRNLVDERPALAEQMRRRLARFLREEAAPDLDNAVQVDAESRRRLMALGYLGSSADPGEPILEVLRSDGAAPQDRVADTSELSAAKQLLYTRRSLAARELIRDLVARDPANPFYLEMLATAELQLERPGAALEVLERIDRLEGAGAVTGRLLLQLGSLHFDRGELERAEPLLRRSLELEPGPLGHYLLANVYSAGGRSAAERAALEAALDLDPTYAPARVDLAIRLAQGGERRAAEAELRRAIRDQPYFAKAHYNLGAFLVEEGDLEGALRRLRRAVELDPGYRLAYSALVAVHLALDQLDEARGYYRTLAARAPESPEAEQARALLEERE